MRAALVWVDCGSPWVGRGGRERAVDVEPGTTGISFCMLCVVICELMILF